MGTILILLAVGGGLMLALGALCRNPIGAVREAIIIVLLLALFVDAMLLAGNIIEGALP